MCNILTELQIHPDEVEDDGEAMLIWDFNLDKISLPRTVQLKPRFRILSTRSIVSYLDPNRMSSKCAKSSFQARKRFVACCYNRRFPVTKAVGLSYIEEEGEEEAELVK